MPDDASLIALEFLLGASKDSMQDAMLNKMNEAARTRKEIMELLEKWSTVRAEALLLSWFLDHGDEVVGSATVANSPNVTEIKRPDTPEKPGPHRAVDLRRELRRLLDSA
jgi:hypothetical protein